MCVQTTKYARVVRKVVAWKLFDLSGLSARGFLTGIVRTGRVYKTNKVYWSKGGPGFQAFANLADAKNALVIPWSDARIYQVVLYEAKKGVIQGMCKEANDKEGWIAKRMKIVKWVR